ncbi:MAG: DUF4388 domain-containing protein [Polyangiaceae bacterium]
MSLLILLVEPDVDVLGKLAEALKAKGLSVILANELDANSSRQATSPNGVIIGAAALSVIHESDRARAIAAFGDISKLFLALEGDTLHGLPNDVERANPADLDRIVSWALTLRAAPTATDAIDLRGDLRQVPLPDLVQLLSMHRRSGLLSVLTPTGNGELRIEDGDVTWASFRHLRGEKAFFRLLREIDGSFSFAPASPPSSTSGPGSSSSLSGPRMLQGTSNLILEAMRHRDEAERAADEIGVDLTSTAPFAARGEPPAEALGALAIRLWRSLTSPRPLSEIIDGFVESDAEILRALRDLVKSGNARRIERASTIIPLAPDDHLPSLRALVGRLHKPGFLGAPRIAVASTTDRLHVFSRSLLRVQGAVAPSRPSPAAPVPYDLGLLKLGEGVECAFTGVPYVEAYIPTWSLALAGVGLVISMESPIAPALLTICDELEVKCIAASSLADTFIEADPEHIATLLRAAISQA